MTLTTKSAAARLPPRPLAPLGKSPVASLTNRPAPAAQEEPQDLLAEGAELESTATATVEGEANQDPTVRQPGVVEAAAPEKPARKPRGPNKPKADAPAPVAGSGAPLNLTELRAIARDLESEAKGVVSDYHNALTTVKKEYEAKLADLRQRHATVMATIASATFSL